MSLKFGLSLPQGWTMDLASIKDPVEALTRFSNPLELYGLLEGSGCRFWSLNHEMLLVEMLERGRISSPNAQGEIKPRGKSGMQTHLLAPRHT